MVKAVAALPTEKGSWGPLNRKARRFEIWSGYLTHRTQFCYCRESNDDFCVVKHVS